MLIDEGVQGIPYPMPSLPLRQRFLYLLTWPVRGDRLSRTVISCFILTSFFIVSFLLFLLPEGLPVYLVIILTIVAEIVFSLALMQLIFWLSSLYVKSLERRYKPLADALDEAGILYPNPHVTSHFHAANERAAWAAYPLPTKRKKLLIQSGVKYSDIATSPLTQLPIDALEITAALHRE